MTTKTTGKDPAVDVEPESTAGDVRPESTEAANEPDQSAIDAKIGERIARERRRFEAEKAELAAELERMKSELTERDELAAGKTKVEIEAKKSKQALEKLQAERDQIASELSQYRARTEIGKALSEIDFVSASAREDAINALSSTANVGKNGEISINSLSVDDATEEYLSERAYMIRASAPGGAGSRASDSFSGGEITSAQIQRWRETGELAAKLKDPEIFKQLKERNQRAFLSKGG